VLGEGGMAVVYAVTHLRNTARLAVKVLHADSVLKGHVRARFVREGRVANSVNHPGAVQMLDDGVAEDGSPYLVMEHLSGVSVADLGARAIPLGAALNIAYQVLDVLRAAHENGIIHRDIKPANLFVLRDGRLKVLDFGISRLHDGAEPFDSVATGSVMGTPFFMAPEQTRTDTLEIDARTDLFAVGATLFTLISGKYLYTGDDSRQVMIQAATQQARSLASVAPATPRAVVDLVAKAVAYERTARWDSAQAMQDAVREVHEALYGPITFDGLATLVLGREFRRKSHAKFVGALRLRPLASRRFDSSPLSTTLPAVADETRSRESIRAPSDSPSNDEAPSSRISAGPSELAGWTGHVPAKLDSKPGSAPGGGSRFRQPLSRARSVRLGILAVAIFTAILGFSRYQARAPEARVAAAKTKVSSDTLPAFVPKAAPPEVPVSTAPVDVPPRPLHSAMRAISGVKAPPSSKSVGGSSPTPTPPPQHPAAPASPEPLNVRPILTPPRHPIAP